MNFIEDCKKELDLAARCQNEIDKIYRNIFGNNIHIRRFAPEECHYLDQKGGIDTVIFNPTAITFQEKTRSFFAYQNFYDVTIEYKNGDGSCGEWFKSICQFEFYGWECGEKNGKFIDWIIFDLFKLREAVNYFGGIENVANGPYKNIRCGSALLCGIPISFLREHNCIRYEKQKTTHDIDTFSKFYN